MVYSPSWLFEQFSISLATADMKRKSLILIFVGFSTFFIQCFVSFDINWIIIRLTQSGWPLRITLRDRINMIASSVCSSRFKGWNLNLKNLNNKTPLWREIFQNSVDLNFYALQIDLKRFLNFYPWTEIWHFKLRYCNLFLLKNHGMVIFSQ